MNLPQPPEGILDPQYPWHLPMPKSPGLWGTLKARLTGRPNEYGNYSSHVNITEADADRLIANMKKDPRGYPQLDQTTGTPSQWIERQRIYQEWLVEEYLENPFRAEVNEKIDAKTSGVLDRVFPEAQEEIQEAETKAEVVEILEDKIDILEDIQEKISPPPTENKIPDPWEGSETVPTPQKTDKKKKKKKPKSKKKPTTPPSPPPKPPKRSFASKFGGGVKGIAKSIGRKTLNFMEGATPQGEAQGPSVLGAGAWLGKKVAAAFQDAKKEKERALEAEANGAEIPPEVKEKGYFLKKSLGYQFGGKVLDQTVGAFFENIPSKQSSKKAGFGEKFDYGDGDPRKKKQRSEIKDLASGFRNVTKSLGAINKNIGGLIQTMSKLVGETSRVADTLEAIQNAIAKSIDVEIDSGSSEAEAQQSTGDINIPDIDLSGLISKEEGGGIDWFDLIMGADDARDFAKKIKGGGERTTTRRGGPKITGDVQRRNRFRLPTSLGRRFKFSEGTASVASPVRAMIGEAGPEIVTGSPKKFAAGGIMGGTGGNIVASQVGGGKKDLLKKVQPFANVMEMPFKVIGAQISGALSSLVSAAGPFSGVIAKMFSPILGGLATVFGLNQGAFAGELNSASMTEEQGAKELSRFFASFFKLFGINIGGTDTKDKGTTDTDIGPISEGPVIEKGAQIAKVLQQKLGIKDYQAAGIVGNLIQESNLVPDVIQGGKKGTLQEAMNSGLGYSYPQWTDPGRQQNFAKYMESKGHDWKTKGATNELATGFVAEEFKTYMSDVFTNTKDVASASNWVLKNYEKPADMGPEEQRQRATDSNSVLAKMAVKGTAQRISNGFANQVQGVFEMSGPDTGYKVPEEYTGGQPVIGHGLEYLINTGNKFVILPAVNKEYNIFENPAKAYNRYEQIGQEGGIQVAGLVDFVDNMIFGSRKTGRPPVYGEGFKPRRVYRAEDESGAEILRLLGGTPIKGASLPEGTVTPIAIPKDTVTGTTGEVVAMIKPVIQYVPMPVPGPERVEYVPASTLAAAVAMENLLHSRALG